MFKRLVIAVLMVMLASPVMAGVVPTGECQSFTQPWEPYATYDQCRYTLDDMGEFVGGVWVWDSQFEEMIDGNTMVAGDPNWKENWKPTINVGGTAIDDNTYLMKRAYADPAKPASSVAYVTVTKKADSINIPILWLDNCLGDFNNETQMNDIVPCPDPYDPTVTYFTMGDFGEGGVLNFESIGGSTPDESLEVVSVEWDGDMAVQRPYPTSPLFNMIKYDMGATKFWYSNSLYQDDAVSFWDFDKVPTVVGPTTLNITLAGGEIIPWTINVTSVDDLPTIPAFHTVGVNKVTKSGKVIDNERTIANISIREIPDPDGTGNALVIQWPEPDGALFGGKYRDGEIYQLRVYIWKRDLTIDVERGLFIDCPAQLGTVVVDAENYHWLKDELTANGIGLDNIELTIMYRTISPDYRYYNRGYSDTVTFNAQ
jgi:hypothetical protein